MKSKLLVPELEPAVQTLPMMMTSLPMLTSGPDQDSSNTTSAHKFDIGIPYPEDEQFLLLAFRSFANAATSLERSYETLRVEVARLRCELEDKNRDLRRSLEENRKMRDHLDQILESLPCGVVVVSNNGHILKANPESSRLLAVDVQRAEELFVSSLPESFQQLLDCAQRQNSEQEMAVPGDGASRIWLAARHAVIDKSTSVFILRDVSERKRLEEAQDRLRREQALAEVSAVLAHEVRNPLGSLELFAGLLTESDLGPECNKWVTHLQAGLRTLSATVNNVLHFHSAPEAERTPIDLGQLLDWARDFLMPLARQHNIILDLQNRLRGVILTADRHRLEQVLLNLVLNSLRATPRGGWIELGGHKMRDGSGVEIVVADTGSGISAAALPRIFEPGFSTRKGSPGLGLAVCRKVVEQHGGTISAASPAGRGAVFTMIFPVVSKPAEGACA